MKRLHSSDVISIYLELTQHNVDMHYASMQILHFMQLWKCLHVDHSSCSGQLSSLWWYVNLSDAGCQRVPRQEVGARTFTRIMPHSKGAVWDEQHGSIIVVSFIIQREQCVDNRHVQIVGMSCSRHGLSVLRLLFFVMY